jgi:hypothetical protein
MKSIFRFLILLILTVWLGHSALIFNHHPDSKDFTSVESLQEHYFSAASDNLFCQTNQTEGVVIAANYFPVSESGKELPGFTRSASVSEQVYLTRFSEYPDCLLNLHVRYRKASIIFPFHNFW